MDSIKAVVPNLNINVWYHDDSTLCGNPADLAAALEIIEHLDPSGSSSLNRSNNFFIFVIKRFYPNPLPSDIPIVRDGFVLPGCPIGPQSFATLCS